MDIAFPQSQHPVVNLDGRRHGNNQRGGGEKESEIRIHAADVHVMGPDDKAKTADSHDGPDHHPVTKNVLARMHAQQVRDDAKGRQGDNVDLRVAKEPEQMLEQHRTATLRFQHIPHGQHGGDEETGAEQLVEAHHDGADE